MVAHKILVSAPVPLELILTGLGLGLGGLGFGTGLDNKTMTVLLTIFLLILFIGSVTITIFTTLNASSIQNLEESIEENLEKISDLQKMQSGIQVRDKASIVVTIDLAKLYFLLT